MKYNKYRTNLMGLVTIVVTLVLLIGIVAPVVWANGSLLENGDQEAGDSNREVRLGWRITGHPDSEGKNKWFAEEAFYHTARPTLYYDEDTYYDNENNRRKERQFVSVTFSVYGDDDVKLELSSLNNLINGVTIRGDSSTTPMVDTDFVNNKLHEIESKYGDSESDRDKEIQKFIDSYIFIKHSNKSATLYIPVKPLMPNMEYNVELAPGVVVDDISQYSHEARYIWSFKTMPIPSVLEKNLIVQSVIEDYDVNVPITIFGKYFDPSNIEVYFNNIRAHRIRVFEDGQKRHSRANTEEIYDGKGKEDGKGRDDKDSDDLDQYLEVYLPRGRNKLEAGLYNITIENSRNHSIEFYGALSVVARANKNMPKEQSVFGTRTLYGFASGSSRMELIRLDHKEPIQEEILRRQLNQYILKSPIVETTGGGYSTHIYALEIPVEEGIYDNYMVLRYDDFLRRWVKDKYYYINNIDQRVIITGTSPGIFVVVEPRV